MKKANMLMLMAVLLFSACKKNDNRTQQQQLGTNCKIISTQEDSDPATTYSYDASGNIIKVANLYGYGNGTFTYQTSSVTFNNSGDGTTQSFNIDASGRITADKYYSYKYNSDGYLIERAYSPYLASESFELSYTDGNLTSVVIDGFETVTITYYTDQAVQNLLGYENALQSHLIFNESTYSNFNIAFTGKSSKNLVKSITKKRSIDGAEQTFNDTYVYKKDADGKIVSIIITSIADGGFFNGVSTVNFTYQCQ